MASYELSSASAWRRLAVCVIVLAAVDQGVPSLLTRSETWRYESNRQIRFENSDLFLLGPLSAYLKEHPVGQKPRVVFFGNSLVWGYGVEGGDALPSVFQRLVPTVRVFNFGVNGFESGNAYLVSKAVIDAVDVCYLFYIGDRANPMLSKLIEVSPADIARFHLESVSPMEAWWARVGGCWRLHQYAYRLQGAWFGTSTRQFLYLHKGEWIKWLLGKASTSVAAPSLPSRPSGSAKWEIPMAQHAVSGADAQRLSARYPLLWDYAQLLASHHKHGVIIEFGGRQDIADHDDWCLLNAFFHPYVIVAKLTVPDGWLMSDRLHLTPEGSRGVAEALYEYTGKTVGLVR